MMMILDFDRRPVMLKLNWKSQTWRVVQDSTGVWNNRISRARKGPFDRKAWGVLWLDELTERHGQVTRLIVWDAPSSDADGRHLNGLARIDRPRNGAATLRNQRIGWTVRPYRVPANGPLSALRTSVVSELKKKFAPGTVIQPGHSEFFELTATLKPPGAGTNCYALGAGLARLAGRFRGVPDNTQKMTAFIGKYSLSATSGLPTRVKNGAWTDAAGRHLPKPGDFFALLTPGLGNTPENRRKSHEYAHVGVLLAYRNHGTTWITADFGQIQSPGGYGTRRVRTWFPASNTLSSPGSGYPPRVVAGWVDIDKHFAAPGARE